MKQVSSEKRILVIMPTLDICGGIEKFFMSYYAYMPNNIKFDIIVHHSNSKSYVDQIMKRGDRLYILPPFSAKNYRTIVKKVNAIMSSVSYDAIHCQMANAGFLYLSLAKKYNIKKRILHSHQCRYADKMTHAIRNMPLIWLARRKANYYIACGQEAGKFMFHSRDFLVLNNAIQPSEYLRNENKRRMVRKKHKIEEDTLLLGAIGRLAPQKNHVFSINLAASIPNSKLLIIGDGELKKELDAYISKQNLDNRVEIIESTNKISDYYSAIDAMIMPSLYEGLPYVGIEAQYASLPCYFSERITKELKISENCHFLRITGPNAINEWASCIAGTYRKGNSLTLSSRKYDIRTQAKKLSEYYEK